MRPVFTIRLVVVCVFLAICSCSRKDSEEVDKLRKELDTAKNELSATKTELAELKTPNPKKDKGRPNATAASQQATVGNVRVSLLQAGHKIDFTTDPKKPGAQFLEALVLVEPLDDTAINPSVGGLEALAADSQEPGVRLCEEGGVQTTYAGSATAYEEYQKRGVIKLPPVKATDRAFVLTLLIPVKEVSAKRLDLKLTIVPGPTNQRHIVWFKGLSFDAE
jgi:hypothetical protein